MKPKEHFHGSDLEKIEKKYNVKKEDLINFSANINPLGISFQLRDKLALHLDSIMTYPDREYVSLRNCIADYVNIDPSCILVGNGSTELISLFIQSKKPKKALIIGPTYSEYEREVSLGGGRSHYFRLPEENGFYLNVASLTKELQNDVDLLVLCNPNNPTSSIVLREDIRLILDYCKQKDITVLIDETYIEFAENTSSLTAIPLTEYYNNVIILRGISKFFAAPGLRLGYAICGNHDLLNEINKKKNPWTINSMAAIAGEIMFTDNDYIHQTQALISQERTRVCKRLQDSDRFTVYKPHANFVLINIRDEHITSEDIFEQAIRHSMIIRDCSNFPFLNNKYFRFCFMNPKQNDALVNEILK